MGVCHAFTLLASETVRHWIGYYVSVDHWLFVRADHHDLVYDVRPVARLRLQPQSCHGSPHYARVLLGAAPSSQRYLSYLFPLKFHE